MTFISKCHNAIAEFKPDGFLGGSYICTECDKECEIKDPSDVEPE